MENPVNPTNPVTLTEVIHQIPSPVIREQAISNMDYQNTHHRVITAERTLRDALVAAFRWIPTPEGVLYWVDVAAMYKDTPIQPTP